MKKSDFRTAISLLVFACTLGILLGGYQLYTKYGMVNPVEKQLKARPTIAGVEMSKKDGQYQITLQLHEVENLQSEYLAIQEILDKNLKPGGYELIIRDPDNYALQEAYLYLQPAIYEAAATNRYVWLDETVSRYALDAGINYRLYVDDRYIYLQLAEGGNSLYRVIQVKSGQNIT
jgi:hypothetical protein